MLFYHITLSDNISSIKENGLLPRVGERSLAANELTPVVYAFFDKSMMEDALGGWLDQAFDEDDKLYLITFETHAPFDIVAFEAQFKNAIHPDCILSIESLD